MTSTMLGSGYFPNFPAIRHALLPDRPPDVTSWSATSCRVKEGDSVGRICQKHLNVLIVDDTEVFRASLIFQLTTIYNVTVEVAETAAVALHKVGGGGMFDLILMDVSMPGMDGIEASGLMRLQPCAYEIV